MIEVEIPLEKQFAIEKLIRKIKGIQDKTEKVPVLSARRELFVAVNRLRQLLLQHPKLGDVEFQLDEDSDKVFTVQEAINKANTALELPLQQSSVVKFLFMAIHVLEIVYSCEEMIKTFNEG
jgi:hypothetical protein